MVRFPSNPILNGFNYIYAADEANYVQHLCLDVLSQEQVIGRLLINVMFFRKKIIGEKGKINFLKSSVKYSANCLF